MFDDTSDAAEEVTEATPDEPEPETAEEATTEGEPEAATEEPTVATE